MADAASLLQIKATLVEAYPQQQAEEFDPYDQ